MEIPVAIAPLKVLGLCMAGDPAITSARSTPRVCHAPLAAHERHHARRDLGGISRQGAQNASGPELEGTSSPARVLAAAHHQRPIGIIQIQATRSWGSGGLSGVAAIPPRVRVRAHRHGPLDALINKGGGTRTADPRAQHGGYGSRNRVTKACLGDGEAMIPPPRVAISARVSTLDTGQDPATP